jgi:hypothetical protein
MWLYIGLHMLGWEPTDPWHIVWGASRHAVNDITELLAVLEVTFCQNSHHSPWLGCNFLWQISDVGKFFFNSSGTTSAYSWKFYPVFVMWRYQVTGV